MVTVTDVPRALHRCHVHRLEEYLAVRGQEYLSSQGVSIPGAAVGVRPGITQGDATLNSEYKPGAGMVNGETIPMPGQAPAAAGRGWFSGFGGGGQQQPQPQAQRPVQAGPSAGQVQGQGQAGNYGATAGQPRRA